MAKEKVSKKVHESLVSVFFTVTVTFSLQDVVICSCAPLVLLRSVGAQAFLLPDNGVALPR